MSFATYLDNRFQVLSRYLALESWTAEPPCAWHASVSSADSADNVAAQPHHHFALLSIPNDLFASIIKFLEDPHDVLSLSSTCRTSFLKCSQTYTILLQHGPMGNSGKSQVLAKLYYVGYAKGKFVAVHLQGLDKGVQVRIPIECPVSRIVQKLREKIGCHHILEVGSSKCSACGNTRQSSNWFCALCGAYLWLRLDEHDQTPLKRSVWFEYGQKLVEVKVVQPTS